ncbi:MAG: acyl-CoA thioesterase [Halobacteriovoraceae bacterium]|mgnify:CR=1 FL=1|jgi:acyl-CoA thioester hydrolase|nr:acyl-CoA thioesterase [Halobacteriovoraceae bacterium]
MARIKLTLPEKKLFETVLPIQINHINYGNHLGHDQVLTLCQEARLQYFKKLGQTELQFFGAAIIITEAVLNYLGEGFHGDQLTCTLFQGDQGPRGFEIYYQLSNLTSGKKVARVKTSLAYYDYQNQTLTSLPQELQLTQF